MMDDWSSEVKDEDYKPVWRPRMEVIEGENDYRLLADLPGLDKDEVEITIEKNVLSISGERVKQEAGDGESIHMNERVYGKFSRSFNLRDTVNTDNVQASFKNGVLSITLPKVEAAKPTKVEIQAV